MQKAPPAGLEPAPSGFVSRRPSIWTSRCLCESDTRMFKRPTVIDRPLNMCMKVINSHGPASNRQPAVYKTAALPVELPRRQPQPLRPIAIPFPRTSGETIRGPGAGGISGVGGDRTRASSVTGKCSVRLNYDTVSGRGGLTPTMNCLKQQPGTYAATRVFRS